VDRIARPARGRFVPVTVAETARLIRDLELAAPAYRKRLDSWFQNPAGDGVHGCEVAALYPRDEIIVYSLPDHFYRMGDKFAHALKPKRLKTEERIVGTLDATEVTR
jgi:hypothetical protein